MTKKTKTKTRRSRRKRFMERAQEQTRMYSVQMTCRADTINAEESSMEVILSSDMPVRMYEWWSGSEVDEVLIPSGARHKPQIPLVDSHDRGTTRNVFGSVRNIKPEGGLLVGKAFFASDPDSQRAFALYSDGHLTDFSVGYHPSQDDTVSVKAGETAKVRGTEYKAGKLDLRIRKKWDLKELSAVAVGADPNAEAREDSDSFVEFRSKEKDMDKGLKEFILGRGVENVDALDEKQVADWQVMYDASRKSETKEEVKREDKIEDKDVVTVDFANNALDAARAAEETLKLERKELHASIRTLGEENEMPEDVVNDAVRAGDTVEEAQKRFLQSYRDTRKRDIGFPAIHVSSGEKTGDMLEASMIRASGMTKTALSIYGEEVMDKVEKNGDLRSMSPQVLCRMALQSEGKRVPTGPESMIREAFSTTTLKKTLGNIARKVVMRSYLEQPQTWSKWCTTSTVKDFHTHTAIRSLVGSSFAEIGDGGEFPHGTQAEEYEEYKISTYGELITLTRKQMINDDTDAFTKIPARLGRNARRNESELVYTALLANGTLTDGNALFNATYGNYNSGGTSALDGTVSWAAMAQADTLFMNFKDKTGVELDIQPSILLVPPAIKVWANDLVNSAKVVSGKNERVGTKNQFNGFAEVVVEPRLSNSNYTGYSSTGWYLLPSPAEAEIMRVVHLSGQEAPQVQSFTTDPDTLGITYRVHHDVGVKAMDRTGVFSAGA